jgi:hypothetical protein
MRAFVTINLKKSVTDKPDSPVRGLDLPYLTRLGIPVFTLTTEESFIGPDYIQVDAAPGMVGIAQKGDQIYIVDSNEDVQAIPLRVITKHQYDRLSLLENSFVRERV